MEPGSHVSPATRFVGGRFFAAALSATRLAVSNPTHGASAHTHLTAQEERFGQFE
jgi:hypothetical protein